MLPPTWVEGCASRAVVRPGRSPPRARLAKLINPGLSAPPGTHAQRVRPSLREWSRRWELLGPRRRPQPLNHVGSVAFRRSW
eukprot:6161571-Pleurochrysis_carterae.AAC.1